MTRVGKTAETILGAIFPTDIYCICCGSIIDSTRTYSMCDSCIRRISWIGENTCKKCGKPMSSDDPYELCYDCRSMERNFDQGYTCCLYDIYARAIVMDLKYRDKSYLGRIIGDILADRMEAEMCIWDLVIPVPISKDRMERRGYNQAALIAERFAERVELSFDGSLLVRTGKTKAMKDLGAMQRRLNIKGAFEVAKGKAEIVESKKCLVVDDIFTTGATLDECARLLKSAGAARVDVLTFAAGRNYVPGSAE